MTVLTRPVEILLVEDHEPDVRLTREALREARARNRLSVVGDGAEALDFLRRRGSYRDAPRPDLIILDLNLPRKDGREVLAEIKSDDSLGVIPVVVMTTSRAEGDILQSYRLKANAYVPKPMDLDRFFRVMDTIDAFWLQTVRLPSD